MWITGDAGIAQEATDNFSSQEYTAFVDSVMETLFKTKEGSFSNLKSRYMFDSLCLSAMFSESDIYSLMAMLGRAKTIKEFYGTIFDLLDKRIIDNGSGDNSINQEKIRIIISKLLPNFSISGISKNVIYNVFEHFLKDFSSSSVRSLNIIYYLFYYLFSGNTSSIQDKSIVEDFNKKLNQSMYLFASHVLFPNRESLNGLLRHDNYQFLSCMFPDMTLLLDPSLFSSLIKAAKEPDDKTKLRDIRDIFFSSLSIQIEVGNIDKEKILKKREDREPDLNFSQRFILKTLSEFFTFAVKEFKVNPLLAQAFNEALREGKEKNIIDLFMQKVFKK